MLLAGSLLGLGFWPPTWLQPVGKVLCAGAEQRTLESAEQRVLETSEQRIQDTWLDTQC